MPYSREKEKNQGSQILDTSVDLKSIIYFFFLYKMKSLSKHVIDPIAGNSIWNIHLSLRLQKLQESSKQPRLPLNQMLLALTETPVDLCEND